MDELIKKQKGVANKIISQFKKMNYKILLAGGAPRNWYFNKPAKDLDFWIDSSNRCSDFETHLTIIDALNVNKLDNPFEVKMYERTGEYTSTDFVKASYSCLIDDIEVQFIMVKGNPYNVVEKFGTSICMFYFVGDNIEMEKITEFSLAHKIIYYQDGFDGIEKGKLYKHIEKIKSYFPDYKIKNISNFEQDMFRASLGKCIL